MLEEHLGEESLFRYLALIPHYVRFLWLYQFSLGSGLGLNKYSAPALMFSRMILLHESKYVVLKYGESMW